MQAVFTVVEHAPFRWKGREKTKFVVAEGKSRDLGYGVGIRLEAIDQNKQWIKVAVYSTNAKTSS